MVVLDALTSSENKTAHIEYWAYKDKRKVEIANEVLASCEKVSQSLNYLKP